MTRAALLGFYWRWQRRIVPELRPSQYAYADALGRAVAEADLWLDVGCGRRPLPAWVPDALVAGIVAAAPRGVGIDLDFDSLRDQQVLDRRVLGAADRLPFADATFDFVSANMVMEHVADPARVLGEIRRVLQPGGRFIFHTPNRRYWAIALARIVPDLVKGRLVQLLEGRASKDVFPTHYRFNDIDAIGRLAHAAGFEVERLDALSSSAVLASAGPLAVLELLWIRRLRQPALAGRRSNFIGVLRVPGRTS